MTKTAEPGPCPFVGNLDHVPAGPPGEDVETFDIETSAGSIRLKPGQPLRVGVWTLLRKIRRCSSGETYGLVEYLDGGLLWSLLAPAPVPELNEWQKSQLEEIRRKIPRNYWMLGDTSHILGDRTSRIGPKGAKMGTVVFMVSTRPFPSVGSVIAMDDGSLSIGEDVMAMLDGRIQLEHDSKQG